jgi:NAD-dependent SIR2 family protein deacetylase
LPDTDPFSALKALFQQGPLAVLTGAGLSTGSGIPAYRDAQGQWQHPPPVQHQAFIKDEAVRRRYWARSFVGWPRVSQAQPGAGHHALADMGRQGLITGLITQNVDGLHQKAGSTGVLELHGGIDQVMCLGCQQRFERAALQAWLADANPDFDATVLSQPELQARTAPDGDAHLLDAAYARFKPVACPACGGVLKPDVVFFGDSVPRARVAQANACIEAASGLLVVGSSLMVYSGYRFAELAHKLGKPIIAINQGVTRADALLAGKLEGDCGEVLRALVEPH